MSALHPRTLLSATGTSAKCQKRIRAVQQITPVLGQMLTDFRQEFAGAVGLRHIVITAGCPRDLFLSVERIGSHRDDRDRSQRRIGSAHQPQISGGEASSSENLGLSCFSPLNGRSSAQRLTDECVFASRPAVKGEHLKTSGPSPAREVSAKTWWPSDNQNTRVSHTHSKLIPHQPYPCVRK
jgi:hypothetical protein